MPQAARAEPMLVAAKHCGQEAASIARLPRQERSRTETVLL